MIEDLTRAPLLGLIVYQLTNPFLTLNPEGLRDVTPDVPRRSPTWKLLYGGEATPANVRRRNEGILMLGYAEWRYATPDPCSLAAFYRSLY